jgi:hypothetical protein
MVKGEYLFLVASSTVGNETGFNEEKLSENDGRHFLSVDITGRHSSSFLRDFLGSVFGRSKMEHIRRQKMDYIIEAFVLSAYFSEPQRLCRALFHDSLKERNEEGQFRTIGKEFLSGISKSAYRFLQKMTELLSPSSKAKLAIRRVIFLKSCKTSSGSEEYRYYGNRAPL